MTLKTINTLDSSAYEVAFQSILDLIREHEDFVTSVELLAIAANIVGKLIALQNQNEITPDEVMEIVSKNIEIGNAQALDEMNNHNGTMQ